MFIALHFFNKNTQWLKHSTENVTVAHGLFNVCQIEIPQVVTRWLCPIPTVNGNNDNLLLAVIEIKHYFVSIDHVELLGLRVFLFFLIPWKLLSASSERQWLNNAAQKKTQMDSEDPYQGTFHFLCFCTSSKIPSRRILSREYN